MIAMQYKVQLPNDYDMNIIRKRVENNGMKTDGFPDLFCKAYLIKDKTKNENNDNEYAPFYLWNKNDGMNQFIFGGYFDNILSSFGWKHIEIAMPYLQEFTADFAKSKVVVELETDIAPTGKMKPLEFSLNPSTCTGKVLVYNPDKWRYAEIYFFETLPQELANYSTYEILHLSM